MLGDLLVAQHRLYHVAILKKKHSNGEKQREYVIYDMLAGYI